MLANVGQDDAKVTLSFFVTDAGSTEDAEEIYEELAKVIKKRGGTQKESKEKEE